MAYKREDMEIRLSKMKLKELKELAKEKNVSLSKCRTKKDYIARIIQQEAVLQAELIHEEEIAAQEIEDGKTKQTSDANPEEYGDSESMKKEMTTMTEDEIAELDEKLKSTKDYSVEFAQVNDMQSQMDYKLNKGSYPELMAQIEASITKGEASFKKFQSIGLSLAIISSEKYIESVKTLGIGVDYPKNLLIEAKQDFAQGAYDDASRTVMKIRDLTMNLHREHREKLENRLSSLSARIQEMHDIGADMEKAELAMKEASIALEDEKLLDCSSHMDRVEHAIDNSWAQRTALIAETIEFVAGLIADAESIGGDTKDAQGKLDYARELFDSGEFQKCMQETIAAEKVVTELIRKQARRAQSLLKTLEDRYTVASTKTKTRQARVETTIGRIDLVDSKQSCPICGNPLSFIEKYSRWYCYSCEQYA